MAGGPEVGSTSRYGAVSRLARRAVLRATRLGTNHQQEVNEAIIEALGSAAAADEGEHRHLTARLNALEVELASALRALAEVPRGRSGEAPAEGWRTMLLRLLEPGGAPLPLEGAPEGIAEVQTDVGSLLLAAHDRVVLPILTETGTWEADESALIDRRLGAGMTAIDLGAHVGYLTIRAARAVGATGRVIAVEPAPVNFALLNANLRRNGVANVLTIPAAAWRKSGVARLEVDPYNTGDHRVFQMDQRDDHVEVPALALDDLLPEELRIDFVKVDTQGTDHAAIEGMARTVERWRPPMLVEFWPPGIRAIGEDPLAVADYYGSLGYTVEILERPDLGPSPPSGDVVEAAEANRGSFVTLWLEPKP